jgi:hypothetical protein
MSHFNPISSSETQSERSLKELKQHIQDIMLPILIRIFQCRQEIQQAKAPPSRLVDSSAHSSLSEITSQLESLSEDLKLLKIWTESCQAQIHKVLLETDSEDLFSFNNSIIKEKSADPAVQKSFQEAVGGKQNEPAKSIQTPSSKSYAQTLLQKLSSLYRKTFP